jgi:hypothetical protein
MYSTYMAKKDRLYEDGTGPTLVRIFIRALMISVVIWLMQKISSS